MDYSAVSWISEMGLDSPVFTDQFESLMDPFDDELAAILAQDSSSILSPPIQLVNIPSTNSITTLCTFPASSETCQTPPPKLHKPNTYATIPGQSNPNHGPNSSAPIILNFENANSPQRAGVLTADVAKTPFDEPSNGKKAEGRVKRAPSQTYDHIVAERKRREQLRQHFVALSTIVPGLKKTDKTSVLGDSIKYLKYLQERVNTLEEQATRKTMDSVVLARKSLAHAEDDNEKSPSSLPEIEARVCHNHILIRVQCENQKGALTNLIDKVEKLKLAIANTHVASFGKLALEITITAEMETDFNLTLNEVVRRLRGALEDDR